ncbi:hypothetical protein ACFLYH_01690 [Candidatus Dependentiae bacterium]
MMRWVKNDSKDPLSDDHRLMDHLSGLLGKVLSNHDVDGLPDMVLHELGHDNCFSLKKATYLIDNPDFDHLLGVAGYNCNECSNHKDDLWENPHTFKDDMKPAKYHNDIKKILQSSLKRKDINLNDSGDIIQLAKELGVEKPAYFSWNMKYGNHGLLIFEEPQESVSKWREGLLTNISALLSFCGI